MMESILDLLPEEPIPIPQVRGRISEKGFNLVKGTCPWCGKDYTRRTGTIVYKVQLNGKCVRVCSWTCKSQCLKAKTIKRGGCTLTTQERIDNRMRQLVEDRRLLDSEAGKALTQKELRRVKDRMARHVKEIRELEEELYAETNQTRKSV